MEPTPDNFAEQVAANRAYGEACARVDPAIAHVTTRNTARDMDLIRAVLGERKLSYFGVSYGTYLGAVYTQLFPRRADRIVLDSALDPARVHRGTFQAAAVGAQAAFERWTWWTAQRDATYHLGTTPGAVRTVFWDLVARADVDPIDAGGDTYTGDDIRFRAETGMVFVQRSAELIALLRDAVRGRPAVAPRAGAGDPARLMGASQDRLSPHPQLAPRQGRAMNRI